MIIKSRANAAISVAAAAFLMSGCDGPVEREAKFMKRAEQHLADRKFDKAVLELRNVLQINPTNVNARFRLGVIEEEGGRWRQAFGIFNQVLTQNPTHLGANLHLARFYLIAGDLEEAEKRLKIVIEQAPENPQGKALQGALLLRRGNIEDAIAQATAARKAEPGNLQAISVLVGAYRAQKKYDDALGVLDESIKRDAKNVALILLRISLNIERDARPLVEKDFSLLFELAPADAVYRIALARVYMIWNLPASAELALRDAIRVAPKNGDLKNLLVAFLRTRRNFADAEKSFNELIASAPTDHIYNYGLASLYLQNDLSDKARAIYESIIQSDKDPRRVVVARNALARLKIAKGDTAGAREQIDHVFKVDPKNEDASIMMGRIEFDLEKYDLVIARMRNVVRDHPKSINAYGILAEAYVRTSRLDLAADTLGIGIGQAPRQNRLRLRLAEIYVLQGREDAAFEILNKLADNSDVSQDAQRIRADIFSRSRRFKEALAALDAMRARGGNEAAIHGLKGQVMLRAGDYAGALLAFEKALELGSTGADVVTGLVTAHIALKQFDAAAVHLTALLQKDPRQAYLHNLLGEVYLRQSRVDQAKELFKKASELDPRWSIPYINLANVLLGAGKNEEAIAVLSEGVLKAPGSELLWFALGFAYQRAEKIDQAIATYDRLLKDNPKIDAAANNLAILLVDYGSPDKATLDRALSLVQRFKDSPNSSFLDSLGWVHYRRGEYAEAIQYLQRSIQVAPNSAEVRYHLGMAYLRNGQSELARGELERSVVDGANYRGIDEAKATLARLVVEKAR